MDPDNANSLTAAEGEGAVPATPAAPAIDPNKMAQFEAIKRAAGLIFWATIVMTVILAVVFAVVKGAYYGLGANLGGAMVAVDVFLFRWFVSKAKPGRLTTALWKTVVKFYLVSFGNIVACFFIIKFNLGSPLTFLAGLGVFLPAFVLGLLLYLLVPEKKIQSQSDQTAAETKAQAETKTPADPNAPTETKTPTDPNAPTVPAEEAGPEAASPKADAPPDNA